VNRTEDSCVEHDQDTRQPVNRRFLTIPRVLLCHPGSGKSPAAARIRTRLLMPLLLLLVAGALVACPVSAAAPPSFCSEGTGSGQCDNPQGIAVDQSNGTVYMGDINNRRVDVFDQEGHFLRAFGFGVRTGADELQTCEMVCIRGIEHSGSGSGPGQLRSPYAIAVDSDPLSLFYHDVYVSDPLESRVDVYAPSGEFLLMFGGEVDKGPHHPGDVCKAAYIAEGDACSSGTSGSGPGRFTRPNGSEALPLAFDSTGDVWVGDVGRLERFSPEGEFISEVTLPGEGVALAALAIDQTSGDFYTLKPHQRGEIEIQAVFRPSSGDYTLTFGGYTTEPIPTGATDKEREKALEALPSVGAGNVNVAFGRVNFVGALADTNVEQMTASAGARVETEIQGKPEIPGVLSKRKPNGELIETLDTLPPYGRPAALGLDPASGDLFVSDQFEPGVARSVSRPATLLEFAPSGAEIKAFGTGEVSGDPRGNSLAFGESSRRLYIAASREPSSFITKPETGGPAAQILALPEPGPLPEAGTSAAGEVRSTSAVLGAEVNPEGKATEYKFEYVDQESFEKEGGFASSHTKSTALTPLEGEADFVNGHRASAAVPSLIPATTYRFRVVVDNADGTVVGETASFGTLPPAAIDSTSVSDVTAESATLQAEINPLDNATSYRFEYLPEAAYLRNVVESLPAFTGAARAPSEDFAIGSGLADVAVSQHVQGLVPLTVYRFRVVAVNAVSEAFGGPFGGPVLSFTTQPVIAPGAAGLPDARAWELVSPPDKRGAELFNLGALIQAAGGGDAFSYQASASTEAEPAGNSNSTQVLSSRGSAGWVSRDVNSPHAKRTGLDIGVGAEYRFFSSDLSLSVVRPDGNDFSLLSPQASAPSLFLRALFVPASPTALCTESCYRPMLSGCPPEGETCSPSVQEAADIPPGTKVSGGLSGSGDFVDATPDLKHVLLSVALTPSKGSGVAGMYEWTADAAPAEALRLVTVLPDGKLPSEVGHEPHYIARNQMSADGSRVIFEGKSGGGDHLYLRYNATESPSAINAAGECTEPGRACTVQLDGLQGGPGVSQPAEAEFKLASTDGSRVIFTDHQQLTADSGASENGPDLYECQIVEEAAGRPGCRLSDLTPRASSGQNAAVMGVIGASSDGSSVYFVADGALTAGAATGDCPRNPSELKATQVCNLYVRRAGVTTLIAVLSGADSHDWAKGEDRLGEMTARVSPSGDWLAFMSQRSLTGYENRDAVSDVPDQEVFLYHAVPGGGESKLLCASCNPTGARPHGVEYTHTLAENPNLAFHVNWEVGQSLAATLPGWTAIGGGTTLYQSRYLSDSGRLFFNSSDSLVPFDTNGTEDVYEYEPPGGAAEAPAGDSCTTVSPTYSSVSGGCVGLISAGTSPEESAFMDASETGNDVFFLTSAKLSPRDFDSSRDVYDARVEGGFPEPVKPPACEGDACQDRVAAPEDPTPASLTFKGPGNIVLSASALAPKAKPLTRAQKRAKALRLCAKKPKKKRRVCEKRVRRAYGSAPRTNKGGK
jgi:hypothetical protein